MAEASVTAGAGAAISVDGYGVPTATPLAAGQSLVQSFQARDQNGNLQAFNSDGSSNTRVTVLPAIGGAFLALPAATTNGTALASGPTGVEITLPPGTSVTYTIAATQPGSAPTFVRTLANPSTATSYVSDQINTATGISVYLTAVSGTPFYRSI